MCSENTGWAKDASANVKEGYCTVLEDGKVSYIKDFTCHVVPTPKNTAFGPDQPLTRCG